MNALAAEIYGKATGCSKGRGGSMHIADPEVGFMGSVPIVAGTVALAIGAATAIKMRNEHRIVVSFFGDGAMQEGIVYESLNLARLYRLPVLFVCENNQYATHMRIQDSMRSLPNEIARGLGYPTEVVDGNNVESVYLSTMINRGNIIWERRPYFMECNTYRLCGHVGPDDKVLGEHLDIRPREEVEAWKAKDPIKQTTFKFGETVVAEWLESIREEISEAHEFAKNSPWPDPDSLEDYVYAG